MTAQNNVGSTLKWPSLPPKPIYKRKGRVDMTRLLVRPTSPDLASTGRRGEKWHTGIHFTKDR
jgi:hypothetical protein